MAAIALEHGVASTTGKYSKFGSDPCSLLSKYIKLLVSLQIFSQVS